MLVNRVALEIGDTLIEREQYPIGSKGGIHNYRVRRTAKSFVDDRVGIVGPGREDPSAVQQGGSHQACTSRWAERHEAFFVRQFCGVGQSGINVVDAQGGIARQNLILGGTLGKTVENHRDGNSGPCCTDLTAADLWATAKELLPRRHTSSLRGRRPNVHSIAGLDSTNQERYTRLSP